VNDQDKFVVARCVMGIDAIKEVLEVLGVAPENRAVVKVIGRALRALDAAEAALLELAPEAAE